MTLRRRRGEVAIEVLPANELPPASPGDTVRPGRGVDGRFGVGNTEARSKKLRTSSRGAGALEGVDESFRPFAAWGRRYGAHRREELARAHGGRISAGVGALVESASHALAASRYLHWRASQAPSAEAFNAAARLGAEARQLELTAWELASREARAMGASAPALDLAAAIKAAQLRADQMQPDDDDESDDESNPTEGDDANE